ncbi:hypothetical protein K4L44_04620 [Halosquirtibacter laminarini]|uniref:Uncharacterized protein n=1 Tax=Halosquirtibacter laminarini TaxID=3374600 RepID=A0AC61NHH7_9BACT|nr:hypothetical protein K4L44_04620 [Prolixibacteraceae bacterium]
MFQKKYNIIINISGIFIIGWVIFYKSIFLDIYEWFSWMSEVGEEFYPIALSLIASWIFYLINVYLPYYDNKRSIKLILNNQVDKVKKELSYFHFTLELISTGQTTNKIFNDPPTPLLEPYNTKTNQYNKWSECFQNRLSPLIKELVEIIRNNRDIFTFDFVDVVSTLEVNVDNLVNRMKNFEEQDNIKSYGVLTTCRKEIISSVLDYNQDLIIEKLRISDDIFINLKKIILDHIVGAKTSQLNEMKLTSFIDPMIIIKFSNYLKDIKDSENSPFLKHSQELSKRILSININKMDLEKTEIDVIEIIKKIGESIEWIEKELI